MKKKITTKEQLDEAKREEVKKDELSSDDIIYKEIVASGKIEIDRKSKLSEGYTDGTYYLCFNITLQDFTYTLLPNSETFEDADDEICLFTIDADTGSYWPYRCVLSYMDGLPRR